MSDFHMLIGTHFERKLVVMTFDQIDRKVDGQVTTVAFLLREKTEDFTSQGFIGALQAIFYLMWLELIAIVL